MKNWQLGIILSGVWLAAYSVAHGRTTLMLVMATAWLFYSLVMMAMNE